MNSGLVPDIAGAPVYQPPSGARSNLIRQINADRSWFCGLKRGRDLPMDIRSVRKRHSRLTK